MKGLDRNVIRFHLQVNFRITVKSLEKKKGRSPPSGPRVFSVPLEGLPRSYVSGFGLVPCFLVDACSCLLERAGMVGLFRKAGSLPRTRALRTKVNEGQTCLHAALPYDVATLIKQFCRELPEPLFPSELQAPLLKAQALPTARERTTALQLLCCLIPARNSSCLHFLFDFLCKVSKRSHENLMTSSNLAMVFAPCLLPPPNRAEMMEARLRLRVLLLQTFIESPRLFGVEPKAVMDSIQFLAGLQDSESGPRKRHSFKAMRSMMTSSWTQPRSKVRTTAPASARRPPLRRSFGMADIQQFRTCVLSEGSNTSPDESAAGDDTRAPHERQRRLTRGPAGDGCPLLTSVGKLPLTPRRRISL